ncbi:hypothetical protein Pelo_6030 [Pelomyxa schiedti]|nr:hypothetical protein Pelo_6030 [Pelomyxa schiedti]
MQRVAHPLDNRTRLCDTLSLFFFFCTTDMTLSKAKQSISIHTEFQNYLETRTFRINFIAVGFNIFVLAATVRFMATSDVNADVESFKTSSMILSSKEGRKVTLCSLSSCENSYLLAVMAKPLTIVVKHTFTVPRNSFEKTAAHALIAC